MSQTFPLVVDHLTYKLKILRSQQVEFEKGRGATDREIRDNLQRATETERTADQFEAAIAALQKEDQQELAGVMAGADKDSAR